MVLMFIEVFLLYKKIASYTNERSNSCIYKEVA